MTFPDPRTRIDRHRLHASFPEVQEPDSHAADIPESLIHFVWLNQDLQRDLLVTTEGHEVVVAEPGRMNFDQGPDFQEACIKIGTLTWLGDIEIHRYSDEWYRHGHHRDSRYDRVILHVTLEADLRTGQVRRSDGSLVPEVVLQPALTRPLRRTLWEFRRRSTPGFPCQRLWPDVPDFVVDPWVRQLGLQRLESRVQAFLCRGQTNLDFEQTLYEESCRALGYSKNAKGMRRLATNVPLKLLRRIENTLDIEALLLGCSGLLPLPHEMALADRRTSDYVDAHRFRFDRLRESTGLRLMSGDVWLFSRLRPRNFPPLRIAQAAAWVSDAGWLRQDTLDRLVEALTSRRPVRTLVQLLSATPGSFWTEHARLDRRLRRDQNPSLGRGRIVDVLTNVVLPFAWAWAEQTEQVHVQDAVLQAYSLLPPVSDSVVSRYKRPASSRRNAVHSQGLHQLYREWCMKDGCAQCNVGRFLLKNGDQKLPWKNR